MEYEWDDDKAASNFAKHGISFGEAKTVFDDPLFVDFYDPEHSIDEHRFIIIGESELGRLLIVSFSEMETSIRIIGARELTRAERRDYEER